jgi:hypothetical protein
MNYTALNQSNHATMRSQQRGIPSNIIELLYDFGDRRYDGHGGVIRFFGAKSRHRLIEEFGSVEVRRVSEYLRCYLVESSHDGTIITVAKRDRNSRFPHH